MIINDEYKFAFVHIPKCAGTTVRRSLEQYDSSKGKFDLVQDLGSGVGRVDKAHIPLERLFELFPEDYAKLKDYFSFAVLRDPFRRFPSSLYQHLSLYSKKPVRTMTREDFVLALDNVMKYLQAGEKNLDYRYIHFQRQKDYIYAHGEKVVDNLYTIKTLDQMFIDISNFTSEDVSQHDQDGEGFIYREGAYGVLAEFINKIYTKVFNGFVPKPLVKYAKRKLMHKPGDAYTDVFESNEVKSFIQDYYREDLILIENIRGSHGNGA